MTESTGINSDAVSDYIAFICLRHLGKTAPIRFPAGGPTLYCRRFRPKLYSEFISGSYAELYIIPMIDYFGDIDRMSCRPNAIVFVDDHPSMPPDVRGFDETIQCFKISGMNEYPGYCLLLSLGDLIYDWDTEEYKYQADPNVWALSFDRDMRKLQFDETRKRTSETEKETKKIEGNNSTGIFTTTKHTGAAIQVTLNQRRDTEIASRTLKIDFVLSFWCPHWPLEASDWPLRPRPHGWPDDVMIQTVVRNGCHVVHAWHPECSENLKAFQMRLSFSYAEIILLRSWTPIQQVVYHMLRFFAKRELINENCPKEEEILSGYHLKTIMLWICENRPKKWWDTAPVVHLLCQLLLDLSRSVKRRNIPNYFIPKANLLRKNLHSENFARTIEKLDQFSNFAQLDQWFQSNYVIPICLKIMAEEKTIGLSEMNACIATIDGADVDERMKIFEVNFNLVVDKCINSASMVNQTGLFAKMAEHASENEAFRKVKPNAELILYFLGQGLPWQYGSLCRSVLLLYGEYSVSGEGIGYDSEFFSDLVRGIPMESKSVSQKSHSFPPSYRSELAPSLVLLLRAQEVMEAMTTPTNHAEFKLLARISLMLLKECLATSDAKSESVRCAAAVYMASLYHALSDYQTASDLSSMIISPSSSTRQRDARALNAFCLLFIDDVARITGFFLLFEKCGNSCNDSRLQLHLLRLSPQLLAEYLLASSTGSVPKYSNLIKQCNISTVFPLDALLMSFSKRQILDGAKSEMMQRRDCVYLRNELTDTFKFRRLKIDENKMRDLLLQWSFDEIVEFANTIGDKYLIGYHSVIVYGALLLFRHRQYADVIKACEYILSDTRTSDMPEVTHYSKVTVSPPFDGFFDKDIQFLLGLQTLCHFCHPSDADLKFCPICDSSDADMKLPEQLNDHLRSRATEDIHSESELPYKTCRCIRYEYVLSDRFVARFLLYRTAIATGEPRSKVFAMYRQIESTWFFEKIVHRFLYQQLRRSIG